MKTATIVLLFASLYGSYILAIPVSINGQVSINLTPVAMVDGKTYFADLTATRTWYQAAKFCSDNGMNLADITTKAEANALQMAYSPTTFYSTYWTSARDAHLPREFTWNTTGASLIMNLGWDGGGVIMSAGRCAVLKWSCAKSSF